MGRGVAAAACVHVVCCALLPLVIVLGVSVVTLAWAGAAIAAAVVVAAATFYFSRRGCLRRPYAAPVPPDADFRDVHTRASRASHTIHRA